MPHAPKLYISYGMPKSGSTLAFELTRTMLEMAGIAQPRLPGDAVHPDYPINFVHTLDKSALDRLQRETSSLAGPVIIKTHSNLRPRATHLLAKGTILGQAVCRDPRDIALSMLDAARENRAWGSGPNGTFRHVDDTIPRIRSQISHFLAWASCANILTLHYEQLAFDTPAAAARIAAQLGLDPDFPNLIHKVSKERFTQKNRAIPQRWKSEMKPADAARIASEFHEFIEHYCAPSPVNPPALKPKKPWFCLTFPARSPGPPAP